MKYFVFAKRSKPFMSIEESTVEQAIRYNEWKHYGESNYRVYYFNATDVRLDPNHDIVPVGEIEFINDVLRCNSMPLLQAINIPNDLNHPEFLHRKIWSCVSTEKIDELGCELIAKPADVPKRFEAIHIRPGETSKIIIPNGPLFLSEMLPQPILAEWRVFVFRGEIVDIRPYILDEWVFPNRSVIEAMIAAWTDASPAYTLDVAVLQGGTTALLEVHNFINCGLYGMESPRILPMLCSAWRWEITQPQRR